MAKQKGIVPLSGTIANITFYKSRDGYIAREKGSLDGKKIANDRAFERTRENMAEFGRAGKAARLLRNSLRSLLLNVSDTRGHARLMKQMMKVVKADTVNERGKRNVIDGEAELLKGFEFNENSTLESTLHAPYSTTMNRITGELGISLAPFVPGNLVAAPQGATHFRIVTAGVELDFEKETFVVSANATAELPLSNDPTVQTDLVNVVTANSIHPLVLAVGLEFFQEVNGRFYPLMNGAFNSLALVSISGE